MTRRDIEQQIANSPIKWEETGQHKDGNTSLTATIVLIPEDDDPDESDKLYIDFSLGSSQKNKRSELYISIHGRWEFGMYELARSEGVEVPVEQLKKIAEEKRAKMACRLLGIND